MIVSTTELARRLNSIACDYLVARYCGPGNPMHAAILRIGNSVAIKVPFVPDNPLMNKVHGLDDRDSLVDVVRFYRATNQHFWVEVSPCTPVAVTDALVLAGFRPERSGATLYAAPLPPTVRHDVDVSEVGAAELDEFLDTLNTGFGSSAQVLPVLRVNQHFWHEVANWRLFIARISGAAAGAAVLAVHGDAGYLAAASTLPQFRRRGIQAALIAARVAAARALGCTLVTGQAEWGSSSQANMQRAGLQISHVRTLWTNWPAA